MPMDANGLAFIISPLANMPPSIGSTSDPKFFKPKPVSDSE